MKRMRPTGEKLLKNLIFFPSMEKHLTDSLVCLKHKDFYFIIKCKKKINFVIHVNMKDFLLSYLEFCSHSLYITLSILLGHPRSTRSARLLSGEDKELLQTDLLAPLLPAHNRIETPAACDSVPIRGNYHS
jgi:hypothetical protein